MLKDSKMESAASCCVWCWPVQSCSDRSSCRHARLRGHFQVELSIVVGGRSCSCACPAKPPRLAMARSSSLLAFLVLALGCSAMLCFVGTTPPASKSLRAPAVQMEARGGADGALGDMTPDTYIIGITVFGIASLFANISGFFNP